MYEKQRTLFSAHIFPTYHQTPFMCYRKPLSSRHSPHTHFRLYRLRQIWFWSFNYLLSQRILVRAFLQHQLSFRLYCLWGNLVQTVHQTQLSVLRNWHFIAVHSICLGKPLVLPVHLCLIATNRRIGHSLNTTHLFAFVFWVKTRFRPVHQRQLSNIHN